MSFVAPTAYSLELLMLWTDKTLHVTFGVATVLGVVLGSFAYAVSTRQFRWEGFASMDDLRTQLMGAVLMGFGGVTAVGCTVGQGLLENLPAGGYPPARGGVLDVDTAWSHTLRSVLGMSTEQGGRPYLPSVLRWTLSPEAISC